MSDGRLRVGVLVDGPRVPRWVHQVLGDLAASKVAGLALVVCGASAREPLAPGPLPLRAYCALDRRFFRSSLDPTDEVDASALLAGAESLDIQLGAGGEAAPADVEAIRAHQLAVLLHFGSARLRGSLLRAARHGTWTLEHDQRERCGEPPGFRELAGERPVLETALRRLADDPAEEQVLDRSFGPVDRLSLHRMRQATCRKAAQLVARQLARLAEQSDARPAPAGGSEPRPAPRPPGTLRTAGVLAGLAGRVARTKWLHRRYASPWFVAIRRARGESFDASDLSGFVPLPCPPGRFFADPFLVAHGGRHWLFVEDADVASERALLRVFEIADDGTCVPGPVVLERPHHLSYPFVFPWNGSFWMIPESSERRTVELHRAVEFPFRWELERVLFRDVVAVDSTLHEQDGRFWLFTCMGGAGAVATDDLFLFHADSPLGEWRPHPRNPVVSDARRARPAGRLFRRGGELIRPGQDCAETYGGAIWLSRVDELSERDYRETPVQRIGPDWRPGIFATHTVDCDGRFEVIDARHRVARRAASPGLAAASPLI